MSNHNEESIIIIIYRAIWLAAIAVGIIWACSWADTDMRGTPPEHRATQR
jgi:flagellar basal body-associated protein FliL